MTPRKKHYDLLGMVVVGAIMADFVRHPEGVARLSWVLQCALEGRCPYCGYLYTHPIVRHLGIQGAECGWR